jgi:hypothetical protein
MADPRWLESVVHVIASTLDRDYDNPWQTKASQTTGTAVAVAPGQFLTSADIVADATFIQIAVRCYSGRK